MSLPASAGGESASFVDLVLIAEEYGRVLAPVPLISQVVAARVLAAAGSGAAGEALSGVISGDRPVAVVPHAAYGQRQLVPDAALGRDAIVPRR